MLVSVDDSRRLAVGEMSERPAAAGSAGGDPVSDSQNGEVRGKGRGVSEEFLDTVRILRAALGVRQDVYVVGDPALVNPGAGATVYHTEKGHAMAWKAQPAAYQNYLICHELAHCAMSEIAGIEVDAAEYARHREGCERHADRYVLSAAIGLALDATLRCAELAREIDKLRCENAKGVKDGND